MTGGSVIGCSGGSPCDQVLRSPWSSVAGVLPVSGLAAGTYLAMLVAGLFIGPTTTPADRRFAWSAMLVLVGAAAGSAVWFTIVQKWIIGAFCPYCIVTHITGLLLAVLVIWRVCAAPVQETSAGATRSIIGPLPATGLALVGVSLAGILAACQIVFSSPAAYRGGEALHQQVAIDPSAVPLVGSPNAPYVVTLLFDYKCPHCQQLHFLLDEAIRRYSGKLAFALRPTPLNSQCNPYVPQDVDQFRDSCELAKVGLAVWLAKREAFAAFDRWMFSLESGDRWHPRSIEDARAKAVELVGQAKFDAARADPWVEGYLKACIRTYGDTGGTAVPKLVFGSHWVIAQPDDADELVSILHDSLTVPEP
ncbi:MAG TPA: vitamin K epoxide reductase family protein [Tepidisphaeraceae bacterium]